MHTLLSSREHAHADGQRGREMTPRSSLSCVVILPKALAGTRVPRSWCAPWSRPKTGLLPTPECRTDSRELALSAQPLQTKRKPQQKRYLSFKQRWLVAEIILAYVR